jgi:hypothetical protein
VLANVRRTHPVWVLIWMNRVCILMAMVVVVCLTVGTAQEAGAYRCSDSQCKTVTGEQIVNYSTWTSTVTPTEKAMLAELVGKAEEFIADEQKRTWDMDYSWDNSGKCCKLVAPKCSRMSYCPGGIDYKFTILGGLLPVHSDYTKYLDDIFDGCGWMTLAGKSPICACQVYP